MTTPTSGPGAPAAAGSVPVAGAPRQVPFAFTGEVGEFFRIWIVNVALSVLTLGIYSAWAKVRTKHYFYAHTHLDGSSFEYLANPLSILKGRLIIGAFLAMLALSQYYNPAVYVGLVLVFLGAAPFLIVQSLKFNAHNSAYRNVRFGFSGNAGEAYGLFAMMGLLQVFTLGAGYPYAMWRMSKFFVTRHLYGDQVFEWQARPGQYYKVLLSAMAMQVGVILAVVGVVAAVFASKDHVSGDPASTSLGSTVLIGIGAIAVYGVMFIAFAFTRARLANLLFGQANLGKHEFQCTQSARELLRLYLMNALGVVLSGGLLIPWARIRLARYRAERLTVLAVGSIVGEYNPMVNEGSAMGDAAVDIGDVGFDFGF